MIKSREKTTNMEIMGGITNREEGINTYTNTPTLYN